MSKPARRLAAARGVVDIDINWAELFSETMFSDLNYCDLLTQMWLRQDQSLKKMDLYVFMPNVSQRTAVKHIQRAIELGGLIEQSCPGDKRARLLTMSDDTLLMVEQWLDFIDRRFLENYRNDSRVKGR